MEANYYDFRINGKPVGYFEWWEEEDLLYQNAVFEVEGHVRRNPFWLKHKGGTITAYRVADGEWTGMPDSKEELFPTSAWILLLRRVEDQLEYTEFHEGSSEVVGPVLLKKEEGLVVESRGGKVIRRFRMENGLPVWIDWGGATSELKASRAEALAGSPLEGRML